MILLLDCNSSILITQVYSFQAAEYWGLSGIVAIFFSGICIAHYSYHNITVEAQITIRKVTDVVVFLAETFVFEYLGLQVCNFYFKELLFCNNQLAKVFTDVVTFFNKLCCCRSELTSMNIFPIQNVSIRVHVQGNNLLFVFLGCTY